MRLKIIIVALLVLLVSAPLSFNLILNRQFQEKCENRSKVKVIDPARLKQFLEFVRNPDLNEGTLWSRELANHNYSVEFQGGSSKIRAGVWEDPINLEYNGKVFARIYNVSIIRPNYLGIVLVTIPADGETCAYGHLQRYPWFWRKINGDYTDQNRRQLSSGQLGAATSAPGA